MALQIHIKCSNEECEETFPITHQLRVAKAAKMDKITKSCLKCGFITSKTLTEILIEERNQKIDYLLSQ